MTDITTYPMIDDFDTTLAQSWDGAVGTVYLNEAVGITLPASTTTYIVVNPWKSTMQVAKINAVNNTLKTATVSSITVDKGAWVAYTQQSHPVGSVVRISTNYAFWKDIIDSVNTKVNTNDDDIAQGKFADATARDAYFTSPVNGNSAYLTAEGKWTDYVAGAWADRASGTNSNASDTVAGKVEVSSQAEFDAGTATGWTWASVVATNDQIRKQISTATSKTTPVNADSIGIADSAASGVIKKTTLTELKAASDMQATTTTSWFVELSTDAEFITGTSTTLVPTVSQASKAFDVVTGTRNTTGSQNISHSLWKSPSFIFAIAKTNSYYVSSTWMRTSDGQWWLSGFSTNANQEPSLSNTVLINMWAITGAARSLNWNITATSTTNITINRAEVGTWWSLYEVAYTFFIYW